MKYIVYIIPILFITGCHSKRHEFERIVSLWNQKEIIFPGEIDKQLTEPMYMKIYNCLIREVKKGQKSVYPYHGYNSLRPNPFP